ncbi:MAG TPA: hypothetical protein VG323_12350 [Thermoanaerobaculia bacterium]|nr:hypothetical protein [Thermoanaerobaculia bacterium]
MRWSAMLLLVAAVASGATSRTSPSTTNNDDSCDIAVQPAATLLLPYFEVDFLSPQSTAVQTLFTVQNVSPYPQIANVTLWTDWAYPVFSFPMFLTGYDVQGINLYDLFARGVVAPGVSPASSGTSFKTPVPVNPTSGSQPFGNGGNPNFLPDVPTACASLPGAIPLPLLQDLQLMFARGKGTGQTIPCTAAVGSAHVLAIGYATIDVVATCSTKNPSSSDYFAGTALFDNVLVGDYQEVVPRGGRSYAQGGPLVHIRAVPEGGAAGALADTSLPYTFYDRYTTALPQRTADRRQPLPSAFAPRYIQGGTGAFNTTFKIWREGVATGTCSVTSANAAIKNSNLSIADVIRFDEHENATYFSPIYISAAVPPPGTNAAFSVSTTSFLFPVPSTSGDVGGWLYLNLNNGGSTAYSVALNSGIARDFRTNTSTFIGVRQSQNWVIASMFAEPTYATEATAPALGNGCTPSPVVGAQIATAANPTP